jgi:hypothetical protein
VKISNEVRLFHNLMRKFMFYGSFNVIFTLLFMVILKGWPTNPSVVNLTRVAITTNSSSLKCHMQPQRFPNVQRMLFQPFFETTIKDKLFSKHPLNNLGKKFCFQFIHNGDNNNVSQKGTPLKAPT